jgi:methylenetetrahydrofolate dehydrogenase (NADP+) / methenyltetrahydrofolate cyclohydrolase
MEDARRIDGKAIAEKVKAEVAKGAAELKARRGLVPGLLAVRVGDDPASEVYVRNKRKACEKAGISTWERHMPAAASEAEVLAVVAQANKDPAVHGILVQLPLPSHIDTSRVLECVTPDKDVDGFHPMNVGRLATGRPGPKPCTPAGIMRMLKEIGVDPKGKEAVIVGRSDIVGKPAALLLLHAHATVTICHSRTADLAGVCRRADILVAAVGRPEMVRGDWVKPGAVVIDVGINRREDGTLVGDVAFEEALQRASAITPVPGGVGPMTIAMLLSNTLDSARRAAETKA